MTKNTKSKNTKAKTGDELIINEIHYLVNASGKLVEKTVEKDTTSLTAIEQGKQDMATFTTLAKTKKVEYENFTVSGEIPLVRLHGKISEEGQNFGEFLGKFNMDTLQIGGLAQYGGVTVYYPKACGINKRELIERILAKFTK